MRTTTTTPVITQSIEQRVVQVKALKKKQQMARRKAQVKAWKKKRRARSRAQNIVPVAISQQSALFS